MAKLKISVNHLQLTGIGKTVNYVRKLEGEVGDLAKQLVTKWKVAAAEAEAQRLKQPTVPLFKLPIKLEPEEFETFDEEPPRKSSSNGSDSKSKNKSKHDHHSSSRNGHSSKDEKKSKSETSDKKSSETKHSQSSHSGSSSKRKHEETSKESKENSTSHKKPKLDESEKESSSRSSHHTKSSSKHRDSSRTSNSKSKDLHRRSDVDSQGFADTLSLFDTPSADNTNSNSKSHHKRKLKTEKQAEEEVDGSQGMGFAEALAMFDMPSTSKKLPKEPTKICNMADKMKREMKPPSKPFSRDDRKTSSGEDSKRSLKSLTTPPKLLVQKPKLEPLPDIVSDLPSDLSIPEYRPLPLSSAVKDYINTSVLGSSSSYCRPMKSMSDKELLTESFSSKANRTRVYSGNRVQRAVPSLFEMCIRTLQENIEFLECTGGVPFDILRPVLDRAKPEQLANIEYFNPYLIDESDVLWEPHCKKKFRTRNRLEMETWRDMYDRCTQEDEVKLSKLTQNIKRHQETTSNGVQKTMLAFVDAVVKPPRNIMRQQEIFGTNRKLVVSPAARTVGLRNIAPNLAAAGDARLRIAAGLRDDAQNGKI